MNARVWKALRRHVAMLCVAVAFALSGQVAMASVDQAQHALNLDHAPNPLAGAVHFGDHHHDHGQSDPDLGADHGDDDGADPRSDSTPHAPSAHHHHGESPYTPAWEATRAVPDRVAVVTAFSPRQDRATPGVVHRGPERPPKADLETLA